MWGVAFGAGTQGSSTSPGGASGNQISDAGQTAYGGSFGSSLGDIGNTASGDYANSESSCGKSGIECVVVYGDAVNDNGFQNVQWFAPYIEPFLRFGPEIFARPPIIVPRPLFPFPRSPFTPPAPDFEWRGPLPEGGPKGNWYNPNTGESLHPDLGHEPPIGPHYDWRAPDGNWYRYFPDGSVIPKAGATLYMDNTT